MKPKVSIIIPVYNCREYLSMSVGSALRQTYDNYEVIVVDDGSTDGSFEALQSYGKSIKVIQQCNSGVSASRNNGIANSNGEFILPLDADDRIERDYLSKTVPLMVDSRVGFVSTDYKKFGVDNGYVSTWILNLEQEMDGNGVPICSLIRRLAFDQTPGYSAVFIQKGGSKQSLGYEDWNLWIDILKRGWKMAVVNEPLFHYRTKLSSVWVPAPPGGISQEVFDIIKRLHPDVYGAQP